MKRIIFMLLLACTFSVQSQAQEVYAQIRQKAMLLANASTTNDAVRQISHFKVNALDYLAMKMKERMPDSTATFLDKEALAMNSFISLYMETLLNVKTQPANYQVKVMKVFIDASVSNPLFNDPDKELVYGYFNDANSLTRFSLDTDWLRANLAVDYQLQKMK